MNIKTLEEITQGEEWIGLGLAGNQAGHLSEAGEDSDFANVKADENAPKGIFPWYIPGIDSAISEDPLSTDKIQLLEGDPLQPEPEIGLVVEFNYSDREGRLLEGIQVLAFGAFNDCSRRVIEPKISLKKNWGMNSKGLSETLVVIKDFEKVGGQIDNYRLVSYLVRDGKLLQYGQDTPVSEYCYLNKTLTNWIVSQINTQEDFGPLENLAELIGEKKVRYGVIGIGATCYTELGNSDARFLKRGDTTIVCAYDTSVMDLAEVERYLAAETATQNSQLLVLSQQAV